MNKYTLTIISCLLLLSSCLEDASQQRTTYFSMDSLVNAQINYFSSREISLNKWASINGKEESNVLQPDSLTWANELEVFRKVDITKAAYTNGFDVSIEDDKTSNLKILNYASKIKMPVKSLKIYFLNEQSDVRKIVAIIEEDTRVFANDKQVNMEFEKIEGVSVLKNYNIEGKQKMLMSDSTLYEIKGTLVFK